MERPAGPVENAWALEIPEFREGDNPHGMQEESKFATLFPKYREKYIRQVDQFLSSALSMLHIHVQLIFTESY